MESDDGEWYHKGESLGAIDTAVIGDSQITVRCEDGTKSYPRRHFNIHGFVRSLPASATVIEE